MDKPLIDDDEIEVKQLQMGDAKVMYVKKKHHDESESEEE